MNRLFGKLSGRLTLAVLLLWVVPVAMFVAGFLVLLDNLSAQTARGMQDELDAQLRLTEQRLRVVVDASRKLSYDQIVATNVAAFDTGELNETRLYQELDGYLRMAYGIQRQYLLSLLFLERAPDEFYFTDLDSRWAGPYRERIHTKIRAYSQNLGTHPGFYVDNNDIFVVRNLYTVENFRKIGTLVLQIDPAYLYLDQSPNGPLATGYRLSVTPGEGEYALTFGNGGQMELSAERQSDDFSLSVRERIDTAQAFRTVNDARNLLWALTALLLLLLWPMLWFIRRSQRNDVAIAQKDSMILALQSQINPHFLNNTLETINWQARLEGAREAPEMIASLSRILDASMSRQRRAILPLREELETADAYLYILLRRLGRRLSVEKQIDESLLDVPVPALSIQPLLENAITHGIEPVHQGRVTLEAVRDGGNLCIRVINDGAPLSDDHLAAIRDSLSQSVTQPNATRHVGIRNINARIQLIYGDRYGLTITRDAQNRTVAQITLPVGS